jgi:hypothetical protein
MGPLQSLYGTVRDTVKAITVKYNMFFRNRLQEHTTSVAVENGMRLILSLLLYPPLASEEEK